MLSNQKLFRNNGNVTNGKGKTPLVVINSDNDTTTTTTAPTSTSPTPSYRESKNSGSPFGPTKAVSSFSIKSAINKLTQGKINNIKCKLAYSSKLTFIFYTVTSN